MRQSCVSYTEKLLFSNARRNKLFWLSRLYYLEESLWANRNKSSSRTKLQIFLQLNFMKRFPFAYFKNFLPAFLLLQLNITSQIPSSLKTQENINKVSILCMFIWRLKRCFCFLFAATTLLTSISQTRVENEKVFIVWCNLKFSCLVYSNFARENLNFLPCAEWGSCLLRVRNSKNMFGRSTFSRSFPSDGKP